MPTTVRKHITVSELRQGDTLDETPPAIVESVTRKTIWGVVHLTGGGQPRRLRLDAGITVLRQEPTPQEQAEQRRTHLIDMLRDDLAGWLKRDPARMLREIADNDPGYGEVLTWSNLPEMLKAQARFKHARILWHHLGEPADLVAVDDDTLLEAFAAWWYTNVHQRSEHGPRHDPLSRSTSIISNIIEDCDEWAVQWIRSRIADAGARPEMEQRITRTLQARP